MTSSTREAGARSAGWPDPDPVLAWWQQTILQAGQPTVRLEVKDLMVVVRQQPEAEDRNIVAAMIDGEAAVKTIRWSPGQVWLVPRSPHTQRFQLNDATVHGKVATGLRRI